MNDFLQQLRSGNKRFDRSRRSYEGSQYRSHDRMGNRDRKASSHRKSYDHGQLHGIKKILETIVEGQKALIDVAERQARAVERIADALEAASTHIRRQADRELRTPAETVPEAEPLTPERPSTPRSSSAPKTRETGREAVGKIIINMRNKGASFDEIAQHLQAEQVPTLSGRGKWRAQVVSRLFNQQSRTIAEKKQA